MKLSYAIVCRAHSQAQRAYRKFAVNPTPRARWKFICKWRGYSELNQKFWLSRGLRVPVIAPFAWGRVDWLGVTE